MCLNELKKAAQAPAETEVDLRKNVVQRRWWEFTICDTIWYVRDAWRKVTQSCICGAWKKLCPQFTVNFKGFDLTKKFLEEHLKCLELVRKVGLDKLEEEGVDFLLQTIGEKLSTEDLDELENQRRQLEEVVEAQQQPMAPSTTKHLTMKSLQHLYTKLNDTMDYLEEINPNVEWVGLARRKVAAEPTQYDQLLLMPSSRKPHALRLLPAMNLIPACLQAGLPALHRCHRRQRSTTSTSCNSPPPPPTPSLDLSKQGLESTFGEFYCIIFAF